MLPCPLPDVSMDRYFGKAVLWASQNQLVLGRGNGIFDPDGTISRQDMVTVFYRYAMLMCRKETQKNLIDSPTISVKKCLQMERTELYLSS